MFLTRTLLFVCLCSLSGSELTENEEEDTTVLEVLNFDVGVKSALRGERLAVVAADDDFLSDLQVAFLEINRETFSASESERVSVLTVLEFKGENAHTDQVRSVDSLVRLCDDNLHTLQERSLSSPITGRTSAVFFSSEDDGRNAFSLILGSRVEDRKDFTRGDVNGVRADFSVE